MTFARWARIHVLCLLVALLGACRHREREATLEAVWVKPISSLRYRSDGEGPYPIAWETRAILINSSSQKNGPRTIAFLVGDGLSRTSGLSEIGRFLRYAADAGPDASGRWFCLDSAPRFIDEFRPLFFLAEPRRLRVFSQHVLFHEQSQEHTFDVLLDTSAWGTPVLLDVDQDMRLELAVQEEGPLRGPHAPIPYTVYKFTGNTFTATAIIDEETVALWRGKRVDLR